MSRIEVSFSTKQFHRILWTSLIALCVGNALALFMVHDFGIEDGWGLVTLLHFDREQNLPTLFSVLLLLGASGLARLHSDASPTRSRLRAGWFVVSMVLALMAIDEFASIHERVDAALRYYLGTDNLPYAAWPVPYLLGVAALGAVLWRWFLMLKPRLAIQLVLAGGIYLSGAVGVEFIAGEYLAEVDPEHLGLTDRTRDLFATLEETLEMVGLILLCSSLTQVDGV